MNLYEDETLEPKLEELSDRLGHLVLELLLAGLRKACRETENFRDFTDARIDVQSRPPGQP
ncbi:MAG: hypothetical protein SCH98_19190 [Deferrisomatales bacterium]|nr:hypothetical protein [Deferrisomatales bacterium]